MRWMCWLLLSVIASPGFAQSPVAYRISFENASHHEAEVEVTFSDLSMDTLEVRMSRTSPGRYALHEFAKNVYRVRAVDGGGRNLTVVRANPHQWNIAGHDGRVRVTYTVYGDRADGTYLGIDNSHAHMNIPATFMWARGLEERPVTVHFEKADPDWKIATQLIPTDKPDTFTAPNLAYFIDSPTEMSNFMLREWMVESSGKSQKVRLAVHHDGSEAELDAYTRMSQAVVLEQQAIYGELPNFDNGTYTFIADYLPHVNGDGMEHRNSTILSSTGSLRENPVGLLGTVSHEFFHAWNVERIRPRSLEPFNLEAANMSGELWFAEGFTSYYTNLVLRRAGILSLDRFAASLGGTLNFVLNAPGRQIQGPAGMSQIAPFRDAGVSVDRRNFQNTFVSYYSYGSITALGLDLTLRQRFPGLTLDDVMRAMWIKHGKTEIPFDNLDIQKVLGEVTGDEKFARDFFNRYILGHDVVDYAALLKQAGMYLQKENMQKPWIGNMSFDYTNDTPRLASSTLAGTPLYSAGLDQGDIIEQLDGRTISNDEEMESFLEAHKPGDTITVDYISRGINKTGQLKILEDPRLEIVLFEHVDDEVTPTIQAFREAWLNTRVQEGQKSLQRYCHQCRRAFPFEYDFCRYDGEALRITEVNVEEMEK